MKNVFVIKNNGTDKRIYDNAMKNFEKGSEYYYYNTNEIDSKLLEQANIDYGNNNLVVLVNYKNSEDKDIQSIFVGDTASINDSYNILCKIRIKLTKDYNQFAIDSIVDKIDLDLIKDFESRQYVFVSKMRSLFFELSDRINARKYLEELKRNDVTNNSVLDTVYNNISLRLYPTDYVGEYRTEFQRDRERVVNCKAFRRLVDKAQIFSSSKGDYYRTRMTHSLEVNQIAKAIAFALDLNLDLTEAIALGHDLGHTPFGHQGERTLDNILCGKIDIGIGKDSILKKRPYGGFKHNYQSARILAHLEEKYVQYPGLNVSIQVIDGVLKHTKMKKEISLNDFLDKRYINFLHIDMEKEEQVCETLEGQVVAVADEIAQRGHDVDDALTSGVMTVTELMDRLEIPKCDELKRMIEDELDCIEDSLRVCVDIYELKIARIVSTIVKYFISEAVNNSKANIEECKTSNVKTSFYEKKLVCLSEKAKCVNDYLERVVNKKVICNSEVARADYNANVIVKTLFEKYYSNPRLLHEGTIHKIFVETLMHENELVANSAVNLSDAKVELANAEIEQMTKKEILENDIDSYLEGDIDDIATEKLIVLEKRKILVRAITDYIAGMTDDYALQEYERLK